MGSELARRQEGVQQELARRQEGVQQELARRQEGVRLLESGEHRLLEHRGEHRCGRGRGGWNEKKEGWREE